MVKKKIKINKKELSVSDRHFGVILEDIDSKLDLVVEGHKGLDKKIDKVEKNLEDFRQDTQYRFKTLIEMTAQNTENIEIIKSDIEFIKNSLRKKVDIDEFAVLGKRVALLERKLQRI